jgi:hypothetical protein
VVRLPYQDHGITISDENDWVVVTGDKIWFGRTYKFRAFQSSYKYTLNLTNSTLTELTFAYYEDGGREVQNGDPVESDYQCQKATPLFPG